MTETEETVLAEALTMTGLKTAAELIDMANVGQSLMERIADLIKQDGPFKGWMPADDPAEIVFDLVNHYEDAALSRAPEAGREGAAERLAIVAEKPAHLIRWGEGDRLDLQSVLAALSPPSTGGEGEANQVGAAEAEVGRYIYRRIERLMDAKPGTVEGAELCYLAEIAEGIEEYGEQACDGHPLGRFPHPSPEMGEISREELARTINPWAFAIGHGYQVKELQKLEAYAKADAILSKLKENGLSREELGGLARSLPSGDAQERSPVPPLSDGGRV